MADWSKRNGRGKVIHLLFGLGLSAVVGSKVYTPFAHLILS